MASVLDTEGLEMSMRNRTERFKELRAQALRERPKKEVVVEGAPAFGWVEALSKLESVEKKLGPLFIELDRQQTRHLMAHAEFGSEEDDDSDPEEMVRLLTAQITSYFKVLETALRKVVQDADNQHLLYNVHKGIASRITVLHQRFRVIEQRYADGLKGKSNMAEKMEGMLVSEETRKWEEEEAEACRKDQLYVQGYNQHQIDSMLVDEQVAKEKAEALAEVSTTLQEIHSMFSDLHALVIEQGTMLDRVDSNIESATDHMRNATADIRLARKHHKRCTVQ
eukprot:TRINITY_DN8692_c0_g2_i1.p1 TRINITY_DN8692_c0_g2~~TRINITY_DN8692_c0_g2_i1.p1  ORF type:complete len:301 (+),score=127.21 TRINITY_DN8692_c0_g2_i1:62-904(+)